MVARSKKKSGMAVFSAGNAIAQSTALLRYALLARIIGPEQLGFAALLILTSQFFEAITDGGMDRFLVQSIYGNTKSVNKTVHLLLAIRGVTIGCVIALSSGLFSYYFHNNEMRYALLILALSPAIGGFAHFDFRRVQRHLHFANEGVILGSSELAGLVATLSTALITRSCIAVAVGLVIRSFTIVFSSHMLARRPYRLGFAGKHMPLMLSFGTPLMLNGVLSFAGGQGDRLFIGNSISVTALGHYSAIILLIFYPATMIGRLVQSVNVPIIAMFRNDASLRQNASTRFGSEITILATAMVVGFAILGPVAVPLIYGAHFQQPALLIALIGIMQGTRFIRLWPATLAMATGNSSIILINGIVRLLAFPLAILFQALNPGIVAVVIAFALGEIIAFCVSFLLLRQRGIGPHRWGAIRLGLLLSIMMCLGISTAGHFPLNIFGVGATGVLVFVMFILERRILGEAVHGLVQLVGKRLSLSCDVFSKRRAEPTPRRKDVI